MSTRARIEVHVENGDSTVSSLSSSVDYIEYLVHNVGFDRELATSFQLCGGAKELVCLLQSGFKFSESDPLLLLIPDLNEANSIHYFNNGNFGLPGGPLWPGGAPPVGGAALPVGIDAAPPHALGRFISRQQGVQDKSHGAFLVFYVDNMENLYHLHGVLQSSNQFRRIGAAIAALFGVPVEPALLRVVTLDNIRGPPRLYLNFNQTA